MFTQKPAYLVLDAGDTLEVDVDDAGETCGDLAFASPAREARFSLTKIDPKSTSS